MRYIFPTLLVALLLLPITSFGQVTIADHLPGCLQNPVFDYVECDASPGTFAVVGNQIIVNDVVGNSCCAASQGGNSNSSFTYETIDISSYMNVTVSFEYSADVTAYENNSATPLTTCANMNPPDNSHDQIVFQYSLNGGPWITSLYVNGTTAANFTGTWNAGPFNANTLQIKVIAANKADEEVFYFENLVVRGLEKPISAGPDVATCATNPVALNGSGVGTWSGGLGTISNVNIPNPNYTPDPSEIGGSVTLTYTGKAGTSGCASSYPPPSDDMQVVVNSGPDADIIGGAELCQGECSIVDVNVIGGTEPFTLNMTIQIGSFPPFSFNAPGFSYMDDFIICYESSVFPLPQYNSATQTLTLPASAAGFTATLVLNSISDNSGCPGSVSSIPLNFEFYREPQANAAFLEACDEGGGSATFDLNQAISDILGSETGTVRFYSDPGLLNEEFSPYFGPSTVLYAAIESTDGCISDPELLTLTVLPPGNVGTVSLQCASGNVCNICDSDGFPGEEVDITLNLPDNADYDVIINYMINGNPFTFTDRVTGPTATLTFTITGNAIFTITSVTQVGECPDMTGLGNNVTINYQLSPDVLPVNPLVSCDEVTLPPIQVTNPGPITGYFTMANGTGTLLGPGDVINATTQLYIFSGTTECFDQEILVVEIGGLTTFNQPNDTSSCGLFILPTISGTNVSSTAGYFTGTAGSGTAYSQGDTVFASTTLYLFDSTNPNCLTNEPDFLVNITPAPIITMDSLVKACNNYVLPAISGIGLTGDEAYYSNPFFMGMPDTVGTVVTTRDTFYLTAGQGVCKDIDTLYISISPNTLYDTIADVSACNGFVLLPITGSNVGSSAAYYTQPGGLGTIYHPGNEISMPLTLFVFDTINACQLNQPDFNIQVAPGPEIAALQSVTACDEYTLPVITGLFLSANVAYYTQPNGGGQKLLPGDKVTSSIILYAFDQGVNCSTQQPFDVTIETKPNAGTALAASLCITDNLTIDLFDLLTGSYDVNGSWQQFGPTSLDITNPASVAIPSNAATGNYSFRYTVPSAVCGPSIAFPNLSLSQAPEAGVGTTIDACQSGLSIVNLFDYVSGNANNAGQWSELGLAIPNPLLFDASQLSIGSHSLKYLTSVNAGNGNFCKDSTIVTFNVNAASSAGADATALLCKGQQVNLTTLISGSTSTGVFVDQNVSGGLSGTQFSTATLVPAAYTILHIIPAQNGCQADTSIIVVTVESQSLAGPNLQQQNCSLNGVDLKPLVAGFPNGSFVYQTNPTWLNNGVFTPQTAGQYSVLYIVGDGNPCPKDTAIIDLSFALKPTASVIASPSFCLGDNPVITLNGTSGNTYGVILQTQTQFNTGNPAQFVWNKSVTLSGNSTQIVLDFGGFANGVVYHVSVIEIKTIDCDFSLGVSEVTSSFTITPPAFTNQRGVLCKGESIDINGVTFDESHPADTLTYQTQAGCDSLVSYQFTLVDSSVYNYVYSTCNPNYVYTVNGQQFDKNKTSGRVKLNIPNAAGCDSIVTVAITFIVPTAQFSSTPAPCPEATGTLNISNASLTPAQLFLNNVFAGDYVSWPQQITLAPGNYSVEIRDAAGCSVADNISIGTDPSPNFSVTAVDGGSGQTILEVKPAFDFVSVSWQPEEQVLSPDQALTAITGIGLFIAQLEYSPGCFTSVSYLVEKQIIKDIYWPNVIDTKLPGNNIFYPSKSDDYNVELTSMEVYDRWGNRLFLRENLLWGQADQGWDGTFNGKELNPGVYVFVLNLKELDGTTRSIVGNLTIVK